MVLLSRKNKSNRFEWRITINTNKECFIDVHKIQKKIFILFQTETRSPQLKDLIWYHGVVLDGKVKARKILNKFSGIGNGTFLIWKVDEDSKEHFLSVW